jgi:hypothetical protein
MLKTSLAAVAALGLGLILAADLAAMPPRGDRMVPRGDQSDCGPLTEEACLMRRGVTTAQDTPFPSGSWSQTCRNARWQGRTLLARCQSRAGTWRGTRFDTNLPFTTLSNCDGVLTAVAVCPGDRWGG